MKKITVIIATHKEYQMPKDNLYLPVQVGAEGKKDLGYTRDNTGDNISTKNPFFCELTGLYWAWKNLDYDYLGLAHYRRHFSLKWKKYKKIEDTLDHVLTRKEAKEILKDYDVILPKKREYFIENLYGHYKHSLYIEPLDETRKILEERYPRYLKEFDRLHKRTSAHMFNMFIMKKDILNDYCNWLFDILFELEKRIDTKDYDTFHARFYGRISELLLDVYLYTNNIKYKEIPYVEIEHINWIKKGFGFLIAKFGGKKYGKSC
ncbi:MAG: DUF4422 domain-containing protein [Bacilli bacterium]|nr:DUF4422 domain-containing protein [Bacilli bacterium]